MKPYYCIHTTEVMAIRSCYVLINIKLTAYYDPQQFSSTR